MSTTRSTSVVAHHRDANLDLLRATAILMVVGYHVCFSCTGVPEAIRNYLSIGKAGVDLFFVLSGWLIGGIYWREWKKKQSVKILNFWKRRWMRTLPPYLVALFLSWIVVYADHRQPFDFRYLLFLQNYYAETPFFKASWSLCVEEHFYLILPWALLLLRRNRFLGLSVAITIVLGLPLLRLQYADRAEPMGSGFMVGASHLRCEGMALGVLSSAFAVLRPPMWMRIKQFCRYLAIPALLVVFSVSLWPRSTRYVLGYSALAIGWTILLAAVESRRALPLAASRVVFWIASAAYSIYLTNVLSLHFVEIATSRIGLRDTLIFPVAAVGVIGVASVAFFFCFERSAILLRERLAPNPGPPKSHEETILLTPAQPAQ